MQSARVARGAEDMQMKKFTFWLMIDSVRFKMMSATASGIVHSG